jgi:hypothetical protein
LEHRLGGGVVADIRRSAAGLGAQLRQARDGGVDLVLRAAHHRDSGACQGEALGYTPVDAAGAAGDEDGLVGEVQWVHVKIPSLCN